MISNFKKNKFLITGGNGFLGKHVIKYFISKKIPLENIKVPSTSTYDLRIQSDVKKLLKKGQIVIHLASNVGGLGKGLKKDADYYYDNAIMGLNLIKIGKDVGIKKFVGVGSILQYSSEAKLPLQENEILQGNPSGITAPYGLGKNVILHSSIFFKRQYNLDCINLILPNLYGPGDDFNPISSHVVASLIHKIYIAKTKKMKSINVWGNGMVSREFLFVKDAAEAIYLASKNSTKSFVLNIGSGKPTTIKGLTYEICKLMNYSGDINWESTKETGVLANFLETSLSKSELKFSCKTKLTDGLKKTINWYMKIVK